ncbi:MAG: hypothetical protein EOP67_16595 [Sphingomonas sp.]|nr:MAG: hypothetical protein EOP67_16595 [Sphingomonas sp.]
MTNSVAVCAVRAKAQAVRQPHRDDLMIVIDIVAPVDSAAWKDLGPIDIQFSATNLIYFP